ncbi:MAG: hypothetical protein ABIP79_01895 [Chitinophagaceae bacterium]
MNAGVWIGIIGGIIGLLVGVGAVVATAGETGIYMGAGMLVIFGGMFYLFYRLFFKPMFTTNRLQKTGISAKATILEVNDTGVTVNNSPQIKLKLEVKNSFGQKYTTQLRTLVSRLNPGAFRPGMEIAVKVDPKNEMNVVIDYMGQSAANTDQPNEAALQAQLMKEQEEGQAISASGKSARAIIKKHTWLGINLNGNNPYVELELEVLPEQSVSFSGKTKGVIAEASIPKFQPGQEIYVKYDLYDNSKIVIDHS